MPLALEPVTSTAPAAPASVGSFSTLCRNASLLFLTSSAEGVKDRAADDDATSGNSAESSELLQLFLSDRTKRDIHWNSGFHNKIFQEIHYLQRNVNFRRIFPHDECPLLDKFHHHR